ncbi:MAG: indole-3-glycerol phosphate synthase TrpC, partial [Planctomycetia bacterium]|nr:indole-3-glycerol phosphate synthase TrpC [Planctomycetia bacterium]
LRPRLADLRDACRDLAPGRGFVHALRRADRGPMRLIAEVKHRSPSAGVIVDPFVPADIAREYEDCGADAVSVLTDSAFFGGSLDDLKAVRRAIALPVLRKDFLFDPVQLYESRAAGADAALLISDSLDRAQLHDLVGLALEIGLEVLVESHDEDALERAVETAATMLGINNRDLTTFQVDIETTVRLAPMVEGSRVIVSESGIKSRSDAERLSEAGVQALLVGQTILEAPNRREKIAELKLAGPG